MLRNAVLQLPPQRTRPWTFLTSNFSHAGTLHLAVNMFALSSFGSVVAEVGCHHARAINAATWLHKKCCPRPARRVAASFHLYNNAGLWREPVCGVLLVGRRGVFADSVLGALEAWLGWTLPGRIWSSLRLLCCLSADASRCSLSYYCIACSGIAAKFGQTEVMI